MLEDSENFLKFLLTKKICNEEKLIVLGRSIGSAPAINVASKFNIGALILLSPFLSLKKMTD